MFASRHTAEFTLRQIAQPTSLAARLRLAVTARAQRAALSRLDDARLADIGISRAQAQAETDRPIWDVPSNWRR